MPIAPYIIPNSIARPNGIGAGKPVAQTRRRITPNFLGVNAPNNSFTVPANGVSDILTVGVNGGGPVQVSGMSASSTAEALVMMWINDGNRQVDMFNQDLHIGAVFGDNLRPYRLPETLMVDELRRIKIKATNISADDNTFHFCFRTAKNDNIVQDPEGQLCSKRLDNKQRITYPFLYGIDGGAVTLTASGVSENTVTIYEDWHFWLRQLSYFSTGDFLIDVIDSNTGESILNSRGDVHYPNRNTLWVGSNIFPFRLHYPRLYRAGQKLKVRLTDISGDINVVHLAFGGTHISRRMWREVE